MRGYMYLLALCVGLRLAVLLAVAPWQPESVSALVGSHDPQGYHRLALNLLHGKGYQVATTQPPPPQTLSRGYPGEYETLWPPGYPAFLALIYALFGVRLTPVLLIQAILSTLGCYWLMRAAEAVGGRRAALWAGGLYAVEPVSILMTNSVLSEGLFIPLLCLSVFLLVRAMTTVNPRTERLLLLGLGAALGAATWVRVNAFPIVGALCLAYGAITWRRTRCSRNALLTVMLLGIAYFACLAPWYWRNYQLYGVWGFSTSGAYNLLANYEYRGDKDAMFHKAYQVARAAGEDPLRLNPFQRARYWRQTALQEWRKDFAGNTWLYFKRLATMLLTPSTHGWGRILRIETPRAETAYKGAAQVVREFASKVRGWIGVIGFYSLVYVAFFYGALLTCALRWRAAFPDAASRAVAATLAVCASASVMTTLVLAEARGRLPAIVLLIPVVAAGLAHLTNRELRQREQAHTV
jgi:4-amino-4-deoxy-L-arabinose transferase-like glycosyltransferase